MGQIDTTKPVYLIVNPHSGYGSSKHMLSRLRTEARHAGVDLRQYTTRAPEDATDFARSITDQAGAVIVWGGDGTVNEVANALAGTDVPILPCPVGTENLLAKELRISGNPRIIIDMLQTGKIVSCNVGRVNNKGFLLIIGVGFDGEVVKRLAAERTGHISHLSYFWPIWRTFWEHDFPQMRIVADGEQICDTQCLAFVGNISRYATGLRICRDAHFDDNLLDLVVFTCRDQLSLLCHAARTALKRHTHHQAVVYRRFKHLRIDTPAPVPCQVDGDVGPSTPLDISVATSRINLIVPHHHAGWLSRLRKAVQLA